jgi:hypothetical protein
MYKIIPGGFFFLFLSFSSNAIAIPPEDVAKNLNNRFNSKGEECSGLPAYACSGILIHTNDPAAGGPTGIVVSEHGKERGTVSFSFLRKDLRIELPYYYPIWGFSNFSGIIMSDNVYNINLPLVCMYALDADSDSRGGTGCGRPSVNEKASKASDYSYCKEDGILTAEQLVETFYQNKDTYDDACSWSANDTASFNEWVRIPSLIQNLDLSYVYSNTEVLLKEWSELPQNEVPLEAYYYAVNYKGSNDLTNRSSAQRLQDEYNKAYGKFIPVIKIDMDTFLNGDVNTRLEPFIYDPNDQVVIP